jgi:preprotein translocase subunit YajC
LLSVDQIGPLVPLVLILAAAYFLLIRPARKRAQEANALQRALEVGTDVMLTSGIYGEVVQIDEEQMHVEIAPGVVVKVHRGAIGKIVGELPSYQDAADTPHEQGDQPLSGDPADETSPDAGTEAGAENDTDTDTRGAH